MSLEEHANFNKILNKLVGDPKHGREIQYRHKYEIDSYYRFNGKKIRVSHDKKTNEVYI